MSAAGAAGAAENGARRGLLHSAAARRAGSCRTVLPRQLVLVFALVFGGAAAAQTPRAFPSTHVETRVFNDQLATWNMTEAQFRFAARYYVGTQKVTRAAARLLRTYAPGFLVLHYRLAQALGHSYPAAGCAPSTDYLQIIDGDSWVQEWPGDATVQEAWLYHWTGQRVFSCSNGHYLADLDGAAWRAWWSAGVIQQLADNEDDGLFADSFSIPSYFGACDWSPCLPAVDATFEADWAGREHAFTDYIQGQLAGQWKWIPNLGALITSRDPSDWSNVDGAMIEGFAEWGGGGWFDPSDWELQLNRVLPLARADKILIAQTYPNAADVDERMFVLGTYLLVRGGRSYVNLDTGLDPEWFPEYRIVLGRALDPLPTAIAELYDATAGVYRRRFQNGEVFVNPGDSTRSVTLGGTFDRVVPSGGGAVPASGVPPGSLGAVAVSALSLAPHRAAIVLFDADRLFVDGLESGGIAAWTP